MLVSSSTEREVASSRDLYGLARPKRRSSLARRTDAIDLILWGHAQQEIKTTQGGERTKPQKSKKPHGLATSGFFFDHLLRTRRSMEDFTRWAAVICAVFSPVIREFAMKHQGIFFLFMLTIMVLFVAYGALLIAEKAKKIGLW